MAPLTCLQACTLFIFTMAARTALLCALLALGLALAGARALAQLPNVAQARQSTSRAGWSSKQPKPALHPHRCRSPPPPPPPFRTPKPCRPTSTPSNSLPGCQLCDHRAGPAERLPEGAGLHHSQLPADQPQPHYQGAGVKSGRGWGGRAAEAVALWGLK